MRIAAAMLANRAVVGDDGLLYIEGGGWEFFSPPALPHTMQGCVAGLIECGPEDLDRAPTLQLLIQLAGQDAVSSASMIINPSRRFAPFSAPFMRVVADDDTIVFRLVDEAGEDVWSGELPVRLPPPPSPTD